MRIPLATIGLVLLATSAFAQKPCASSLPAYDPYKPSDLAIMREYAGTVLAQAPLSTLLTLDPYVPSQGELLRQLGRAIPVWTASPWYPNAILPSPADCPEPEQISPDASAEPALTRFSDALAELERRGAAAPARGVTAPSGARPAPNAGVSIEYASRTWISAGAAVTFREADFVRVGESAGLGVYRRAGASDDVIFVPTSRGMVAPFRAAP